MDYITKIINLSNLIKPIIQKLLLSRFDIEKKEKILQDQKYPR
jgi:hypothetical protein